MEAARAGSCPSSADTSPCLSQIDARRAPRSRGPRGVGGRGAAGSWCVVVPPARRHPRPPSPRGAATSASRTLCRLPPALTHAPPQAGISEPALRFALSSRWSSYATSWSTSSSSRRCGGADGEGSMQKGWLGPSRIEGNLRHANSIGFGFAPCVPPTIPVLTIAHSPHPHAPPGAGHGGGARAVLLQEDGHRGRVHQAGGPVRNEVVPSGIPCCGMAADAARLRLRARMPPPRRLLAFFRSARAKWLSPVAPALLQPPPRPPTNRLPSNPNRQTPRACVPRAHRRGLQHLELPADCSDGY